MTTPSPLHRLAGTTLAVAALATASVAGATAASAQEVLRGSLSFPADTPVVECDGGVGIGLALDVDYAYHWTYEGDELVQERLILRYSGWFENQSTGERSDTVRGTGNTVVDFVAGTRTLSGTGRSMTLPGVGKVLHEAGHSVLVHETGEVLSTHGPLVNEATAEGARSVCAAMGLTGGVPLEPPDVHD
ncbi:hypothetical protein [Oryzobacter terrae]|uniref:hypothetical protein n=1 Tax=Oryzobacter terrae TaxID=1620385 RepID=UPI00366E2426